MKPSLIFDFKRYAINDGPGIRITVFFKGCPLSCIWCHNPESHTREPQKMYTREKCFACDDCVDSCPQGACQFTQQGVVTDPALCILCGKCADFCPTKATEMSGVRLTVDEVMDEIRKERHVMDPSGGGVTFSGGEPLMHPELLIPLLNACGEEGIHRCVDTSGFTKPELLLDVASRSDLFLYDLKTMDSDLHKRVTGVPNKQILENLQLLAETGVEIMISIPLIKDMNDSIKNIEETAAFISSLSGEPKHVRLLPYHNVAKAKQVKLGINGSSFALAEPGEEQIEKLVNIFNRYGLSASVGG